MSEIIKNATLQKSETDEAMLAKINQYTLKELTADDVFVFKCILCDNEIDRDGEAFTTEALKALATMYIGKTMISNHSANTKDQCARIFDAAVEECGELNSYGDTYCRIVAMCYIPRVETSAVLISEIETGIKREVSVGCAVGSVTCSICGANRYEHWCEHIPGNQYEKEKCFFKLEKATDAYEVSFVAVPAQPKAGTTKDFAPQPQAKKEHTADNAIDEQLIEAFIFSEKERKINE